MVSEADLNRVLKYLEERLVLIVPQTNHSHLGAFLTQRLTQKALDIPAYLTRLETDHQERALIVDAATIRETYFFRDESHFQFLKTSVLPYFRDVLGRAPRVWSAACSSGEEALSLAALMLAVLGPSLTTQEKIWASDINDLSIAALTHGRYRTSSLREDGARFHGLLESHLRREGQELIADPRLLGLVKPIHLNLMTDSFDVLPGVFDLILLRNMMIYLPHEKRGVIYRKIGQKLSPEGFLLLGKSEAPFFEDDRILLSEDSGLFFHVHRDSSFQQWRARS